MTGTYETTLFREDDKGNELEIPIRVSYTCYPARRGARDSLCGVRGAGPPLEPDEPAYVEVEQVFQIGEDGQLGPEIDNLTPLELQSIGQEIWDNLADQAADCPED